MYQSLQSLNYEDLREMVKNELMDTGWSFINGQLVPPSLTDDKAAIRASHRAQRIERASLEIQTVKRMGGHLLKEFANGSEINPLKFKPILTAVNSGSPDNMLFRFATLLWSIPVSAGYGRRMRYIIRDEYNGKLVGIFALKDPVFNLQVRDKSIGWDVHQREDRLYHVMDAYILGAVPPYNKLLGGKMVALTTVSDEVRKDFNLKYQGKETVIRRQQKNASLVLITTTSALGRSSIYNRIQLPQESSRIFQSLGFSRGWGHYQFSEGTFLALRNWLRQSGDPYADGHSWDKSKKSSGPNWRMRTIRKALSSLGFDEDLLHHGIKREVFLAPLASDYREFLNGKINSPQYFERSLNSLTSYFIERWMLPRSLRNDDWCNWTRLDTWSIIMDHLGNPQIHVPNTPLF